MNPDTLNIDDVEVSLQRLRTGLEKTMQVFRFYEENGQGQFDVDQSTTSKHPQGTRKCWHLCNSANSNSEDDEKANNLKREDNSSFIFSESSSSDSSEPATKSNGKKMLWRNKRRAKLMEELSLVDNKSDIYVKTQVIEPKGKQVNVAFEKKQANSKKGLIAVSNTSKKLKTTPPSSSKTEASDGSKIHSTSPNANPNQKFDTLEKNRRNIEERRSKYSLPFPLPPYSNNEKQNHSSKDYCNLCSKDSCIKTNSFERTEKNVKPLKAKERSLIPIPVSNRKQRRSEINGNQPGHFYEKLNGLPKTEITPLYLHQERDKCLSKFQSKNARKFADEQTFNDQYKIISCKQKRITCRRRKAKSKLDNEQRVHRNVDSQKQIEGNSPLNYKQTPSTQKNNQKEISNKLNKQSTAKKLFCRKKPFKRRIHIQEHDPRIINNNSANQINVGINQETFKKENNRKNLKSVKQTGSFETIPLNKQARSFKSSSQADSSLTIQKQPSSQIKPHYRQRGFHREQPCGRIWLFGREKSYDRWKPSNYKPREDGETNMKLKRRYLSKNNSPGNFWRFDPRRGYGSNSKPPCPCPCCNANVCCCRTDSCDHYRYYITQNNLENKTQPSNRSSFDKRQKIPNTKQNKIGGQARPSNKFSFDEKQANIGKNDSSNNTAKHVNQLWRDPTKPTLENKDVQTPFLAKKGINASRLQGDENENVFVQYRPFTTDLQNMQLKKVTRPYVYFNDGKRRVDYVLVHSNEKKLSDGFMKLNRYLLNLGNNGLDLEEVASKNFPGITYVKVHAPAIAIMTLAKVRNIELAFQRSLYLKEETALFPCMNTILTTPNSVKRTYKRNPETVSGAQPTEPTNAERIMLVYEVLKETKFGSDPREYGIRELLKLGILETGYPLHDSKHQWSKKGPLSDRQLLYAYWANTLSCCKKQPIQLIYKYFGSEVAFYYAWLSVYDSLLLPAVIFGITALMYGVFTMNKTQNMTIKEVCAAKTIICPLCSRSDLCSFQLLNDSCTYSKINYVFDNHITVLFAICMSFWAIVLMMFWKRQENMLKIDWGLYYLMENDAVRQNFNRHTSLLQLSPKPRKDLSLSTSQMRIMWLLSGVAMLFLVILIILMVLGIGLYRVAAKSFLSSRRQLDNSQNVTLQSNAGIHAAITGSLLSALFMIMFSSVCSKLSNWLTKLENPRTQVEYDRSYAIKLFVLEFANNYAVAFYLAFFRGALYTHPGSSVSWKIVFGIYNDVCDPSGCVADLTIHIIIIMTVKALVNISKHILIPITLRYLTVPAKYRNATKFPQWEQDYVLFPNNYQCITKFCAESMVQFGFLVFFVAAFPLMPLLAFLNNEIQIRATATKLVRFLQRPFPKLIPGLQIWDKILEVMIYMSIIINALVIAFTTDFISKRMYASETSNSNLFGYVNYTLSEFSTKHFDLSSEPTTKICYYKGKRYPSDDGKLQYKYRPDFFQEMTGKLVFVIVTIFLLLIFATLIYCLIPHIPRSVQEELRNQERKHENN